MSKVPNQRHTPQFALKYYLMNTFVGVLEFSKLLFPFMRSFLELVYVGFLTYFLSPILPTPDFNIIPTENSGIVDKY